jgi:hypothetical protein
MIRSHLLLLLLAIIPLGGQTGQSPLPNSELKDPPGQKAQFRFHTLSHSAQIYTCRQSAAGFAWAGPDPDAMLMGSDKKFVVHHYKGPTWEADDGSIVRSDGTLARHFLPADKNAIHWLELPAKEQSGQFAKVTFIHRIDTSGGLTPSDKPCDAQHAGDQERVEYSATYMFYVGK